MTPRLTGALLLAASVYVAPAPAACDEAQARPSTRIVTPSEPGGSVDVLWPQAGSLPGLQADDAVQQRLASAFRVYVEAAGAASPMAGRYELLADRFRFTPQSPFRQGIAYAVSIDEDCLLVTGAIACASTTLPDIAFTITTAEHAAARVAAVEPQADRLPANLLRFYVHFSAPMAQGDAYRHISLVRVDGSLVPSPFLNLARELWDREQKRLTVLLDPGRIKRGVGPHLAAGPPLVEGETYIFRVGPGLRDAGGRVLTEAFEKTFVAVAPEADRIDPRRWTIMTPSRGSREPLRVETAVHIDSGAFGGAIRIVTERGETVAGTASLLPGSPAWQFIPDREWHPGRYRIEVRTEVEDVSGNSVQSAFDAIAGRLASRRDEQRLLSFEIGER
jgi:hypothetical protein